MQEAKEREGERKGMERKGTNEKRGVAAHGDIALLRQREDAGCCTGPVEMSLLKGNKIQKEGRKMALGRGYRPSQHTPHGWEHRGSTRASPAHTAVLWPGPQAQRFLLWGASKDAVARLRQVTQGSRHGDEDGESRGESLPSPHLCSSPCSPNSSSRWLCGSGSKGRAGPKAATWWRCPSW